MSRPYKVLVLDGDRTDERVNYQATLCLPKDLPKDIVESALKIYQILEDCCDLRELGAYDIEVAYKEELPIGPRDAIPITSITAYPFRLDLLSPRQGAWSRCVRSG